VLDAPALHTALQALTLAVGIVVVANGLAGSQDPDVNPAPRALYVLLWVGLVPASLLFGPVWRVLNPLRLLHRASAAVLRRQVQGSGPMPAALGYLPAAAGLLVFVWLELVAPDRDRPAVVAGFLLVYAVVHTGCALRFGERWFARGDVFEVYSSLTGALAPFGRLGDGRIGLHNPFRGLAAVTVAPGLVAFVSVWWGSTVFDGLTGWTGWRTLGVLLDTFVLVGMVLAVAVLYRAATGRLAGPLASTLVPIAAGYTIAHYAVLLLVEGPAGSPSSRGRSSVRSRPCLRPPWWPASRSPRCSPGISSRWSRPTTGVWRSCPSTGGSPTRCRSCC
jgi:hypothetical protein